MMKLGVTLFYMAVLSVLLIALVGCSHNSALLMMGKKASIGVDPQTYTVNAQYMDGLALGDVSRENSSWELNIDDNAGVSYDAKTGTLKGIKHIKRELGPQISGYLTTLAEKDPESARTYLKATEKYWEAKAEEAKAKNASK
jgi:hypothetical protein